MKIKNNIPFFTLQHVVFLLTIALLTLTVLTQANPGTNLPQRDYGFYLYIGEKIIDGGLPYIDAWDSKPPAIFYLNAVALWIGRGSRWGVWIVEFIFLFSAIFLSFNLLKRLWGLWPAIFGMVIWLIGLDQTLEGGNFTEEYPLLFHFLSLIVFVKLIEHPQDRPSNLVLGCMFSLSFLFRPNNALLEAIIIMLLAFSQIIQRNFRNLLTHTLWITLGVLPPILITILYFWSQGILWDMLDGAILHNLAYTDVKLTVSSPLVVGFKYLQWPAWLALFGYVALLSQLKKSFGSSSFLLLIFLAVGWPLTISLSDPAKRNYAHYFMNWLPFLALLSGFGIHFLMVNFPKTTKVLHTLSPFALLITLSVTSIFLISSGRINQYQKALERIREGLIEMRSPYAIYVENHTRPGEYVIFWATLPGENFMANREAPYSLLIYPTLVESDTTKKLNDDFLQDILEHPPVLIVDMGHLDPLSLDPQERAEQRKQGLGWPYPPDNLEEVFSFIEKNYYLEANIKGKNIYRLYGTQAP